jgi:hypothetical protein
MRTRTFLLATLAVAAALPTAGCGGGSGPSGISAADAKAAVEQAAHLHLAALDLPGEARKEGVVGAYSNAATVDRDRQFVFLFALEDAGTLSKVKDMLKGSFSSGHAAEVITHDNLMVLYGQAGNDHLVAVAHAVNAL